MQINCLNSRKNSHLQSIHTQKLKDVVFYLVTVNDVVNNESRLGASSNSETVICRGQCERNYLVTLTGVSQFGGAKRRENEVPLNKTVWKVSGERIVLLALNLFNQQICECEPILRDAGAT